MKTKILAGVILVTLATAGTLTYAASTTGTGNLIRNAFSGMHRTGSGTFNEGHYGKMGGRGFGWSEIMERGGIPQLSDAEKTKLTTMTDGEKKVFFESKIAAEKTLQDTKEAVIDKLINGETLTDTEKVTLATIKTERAALKAERLAREAQITEIKPIMEKVRAGTTLTTEEQTKFDAFKATMKQDGKWGRGGMMGR